jgi:hypothetical protein
MKDAQAIRENLQPSKENLPALQNMKIIYFFLILWVTFAILDPDPATQIIADPDPHPCFLQGSGFLPYPDF